MKILVLHILLFYSFFAYGQYAGLNQKLFFNVGIRASTFKYYPADSTDYILNRDNFVSANYEMGLTYRLPKYHFSIETRRSFTYLLSGFYSFQSFIRAFKSNNYIGVNYCFKNKPIEVGLFHAWTRDDNYSRMDTLMDRDVPFGLAYLTQGPVRVYKYAAIGMKVGYFFHPNWRIGVETLYYYRKKQYFNNFSNVSLGFTYFFHPKSQVKK